MDDEFKVVLPLAHPRAEYEKIPVTLLEDEDFIFPSVGADYGVGHILESSGITPNIRFRSEDDYTAIAMTELGLGITILPQLILDGAQSQIAT